MLNVVAPLQPGDHAVLFYRNRKEQLAAAIAYIQLGLERNERCLYIAGDNSVRMIIDAMEAAGIDVDQEQKAGRLAVAPPERTYLRNGVFEPVKMIEGLKTEIQVSLGGGFSAFRATGELGWALTLPSALLRLYEYEALFELNMAPVFVALCQYNETTFPPHVISQMLRIHPKVVARGELRKNPFYLGPLVPIEKHPAVSVDELFDEATECHA